MDAGKRRNARTRGLLLGRWLAGLVLLTAFLSVRSADSAPAQTSLPLEPGRFVFALPGDGHDFLAIDVLAVRASRSSLAEGLARLTERVRTSTPGAVEAQVAGNGYWWPTGSAAWSYDPAGKPADLAGDLAAIEASAGTWNNAGAAFRFLAGGESAAGTGACSNQPDGRNTVGWGPLSGTLLAVTCSFFRDDGGPLGTATEFDMQLDPEWGWTTGSPINVDLESVATHEFGHALGLGHSAEVSDIMFGDYAPGTPKRALAPGDQEGLLGLYGRRPPPAPPSPAQHLPEPPLVLAAGANLIAWPGDTSPPAAALAGMRALRAVYAYDRRTGEWLRFLPGQPSYLNTLGSFSQGDAYWFLLSAGASLPVLLPPRGQHPR